MLDIIALVASSDAQSRITKSLGRRASVHVLPMAQRLSDVVADVRPSAVVAEFSDQAGAGFATAVRELRAHRPTLPIIGYCWVEAQASRHLMLAARAGVNALALRGVDDLGIMLEQVLVEAEGDCSAEEVTRSLLGRVPKVVQDVLTYCTRNAHNLPDVDELSEALGMPRRTLAHRLYRAGSPSAAALISWSRLLAAAEMLVDDRRSVEQAALALGFASGSALRGMLQRYAGVTPRELRARGGLTHLLDLLLARFSDPEASVPLSLGIAVETGALVSVAS